MGPLKGLKIIEVSALGPGPFCGMLFADLGADVVCVDREAPPALDPATDCTRRGKRSIVLDLKSPGDRKLFLDLVSRADALFEGFRPGVMEKLHLGPDECMAANPALTYGRMTGWGQYGPLSQAAGHDINYISLTGVLHAIGRKGEKPVPPLNLVGDFGGGAMLLALGMVSALLEARASGKGQVVDAAMTDGSALLMTLFHSLEAQGRWSAPRGSNLLDSGAHFYDVYETSDSQYVSIGSIEPQFYALLLEKAGLSEEDFGGQNDVRRWPEMKAGLEAVFKTRSRDEWCELLEGTDVCFAPVLDFREAPQHPHNQARQTYVEVGGLTQPAPAPRFSRTQPEIAFAPHQPGSDLDAVLDDWGAGRPGHGRNPG
ncbi:MAG: CoA transferase [Xanthomonadales bacterium]|nr:CoA transferase [Gammaproteobacteria bacterium]MBT8054261.1 CoA transferase [Gammaproteobacteria bacterium]NND57546.1 CoA transferase [Xanthomonadales bacterium]NNK51270.1 CoA transferase [Xanthomonadales bacterium]